MTLALALAFGGLGMNAQAESFDPEFGGEVSSLAALNTGSSCNHEGHVVRVSAYLEDQNSYVYWRESALSNTYNYALINDSQILNAAMHAMNGPVKVRIRTDEGCSSNSFKGFATRIQLNP